MLVVLSQRIDIESEYADELFTTYHYPSRYRNQLHVGDVFVYYQGNRYNKDHRYYFGTGIVAEISAVDEENYYAKLSNCRRFERKVSIYLPDGGYIEQLGYQDVRKSINPPWQSSIRPVSEQAYNHILRCAGIQKEVVSASSIADLKEQLKRAIRSFYIERDDSAILEIEETAATITRALNLTTINQEKGDETRISDCQVAAASEKFLSYCENMQMSYSYKPVLILAFFELHDKNWNLPIAKAAVYFNEFYRKRRANGLPVERKKCIYQDPCVTLEQITANIIANPVKALVASSFFEYDSEGHLISLRPDLKKEMNKRKTNEVLDICRKRLGQYFSKDGRTW